MSSGGTNQPTRSTRKLKEGGRPYPPIHSPYKVDRFTGASSSRTFMLLSPLLLCRVVFSAWVMRNSFGYRLHQEPECPGIQIGNLLCCVAYSLEWRRCSLSVCIVCGGSRKWRHLLVYRKQSRLFIYHLGGS